MSGVKKALMCVLVLCCSAPSHALWERDKAPEFQRRFEGIVKRIWPRERMNMTISGYGRDDLKMYSDLIRDIKAYIPSFKGGDVALARDVVSQAFDNLGPAYAALSEFLLYVHDRIVIPAISDEMGYYSTRIYDDPSFSGKSGNIKARVARDAAAIGRRVQAVFAYKKDVAESRSVVWDVLASGSKTNSRAKNIMILAHQMTDDFVSRLEKLRKDVDEIERTTPLIEPQKQKPPIEPKPPKEPSEQTESSGARTEREALLRDFDKITVGTGTQTKRGVWAQTNMIFGEYYNRDRFARQDYSNLMERIERYLKNNKKFDLYKSGLETLKEVSRALFALMDKAKQFTDDASWKALTEERLTRDTPAYNNSVRGYVASHLSELQRAAQNIYLAEGIIHQIIGDLQEKSGTGWLADKNAAMLVHMLESLLGQINLLKLNLSDLSSSK